MKGGYAGWWLGKHPPFYKLAICLSHLNKCCACRGFLTMPPGWSWKDPHVTIIITPLFKELHWLPVQFRSQYKLATLAYRHFDGSLPQYLSSCLSTYETYRTLRSSHEKLLKILKYNFKTFDQRSFSFLVPTVWNSLPSHLRSAPSLASFKKQANTHLLRQTFS